MTTRLQLGPDDLVDTRFESSPLLEMTVALRAAQLSGPSPLSGWSRQVRDLLDHPDIRTLLPLARPDGSTPQFLGIPRTGERMSGGLGPSLASLAALPAREVVSRVHECAVRPTVELQRLLASPDPSSSLAQAAETAFRLLVAPWWPRIRRTVRSDIAAWMAQAASHGFRHVLGSLHEGMVWNGDVLVRLSTLDDSEVDCRGRGLVLFPSGFAWHNVGVSWEPGWETCLLFPTASIGSIWDESPRPGIDGLAGLLGRGRASVLRATVSPCTTTEAAQRLGLSQATVSEHLGALRAGHLVASYRRGRAVVYQPTDLGRDLLRSIDGAD